MAFNRLSHETQQSYTIASARQALHNRFKPDINRELYKVELEKRNKSDKESWADYEDSLSQLVRKAFPNLQDKARKQLVLNRYMEQLNDPQILFAVKQQPPKSTQEAVSATIELQSYLVKPYMQGAVLHASAKRRGRCSSCHQADTSKYAGGNAEAGQPSGAVGSWPPKIQTSKATKGFTATK